MSNENWCPFGYGIRVDDIELKSVERLQTLISLYPDYEKNINKHFKERKIKNPTIKDYLEDEAIAECGLASILRIVIDGVEEIEFTDYEDIEGDAYLLYVPRYPWCWNEKDKTVTESMLYDCLQKYIGGSIENTDLENIIGITSEEYSLLKKCFG